LISGVFVEAVSRMWAISEWPASAVMGARAPATPVAPPMLASPEELAPALPEVPAALPAVPAASPPAPDVPPALVSLPASARPAVPVKAVVVPDVPSDEQAPQAMIEAKLTNRKPTLTCIDIPQK
jgi:hypothetical protein